MKRFKQYLVFSVIICSLASSGCSLFSSILFVASEAQNQQNTRNIYGNTQVKGKCAQFQDKAIESYALAQWDDNNDGCISPAESQNATQIPKYAFAGNEDVTTLNDLNQFPNLKTIEEGAFAAASKLANVRLFNVSTIAKDAFNGCPNLTELRLAQINKIGESAFKDCANLVEVDISNITEIGAYAFAGTDIKYGPNRTNTIDLKYIKKLGIGAFSDIGSATTNNTVKFVMTNAIKYEDTRYIANYLNFPEDLFANNKNISEFYFISEKETVVRGSDILFESGMFRDCTSLSRVVVESKDIDVSTKQSFTISLEIKQNTFKGANKLRKFECSTYNVNSFGDNPNITSILVKPQGSSPNVSHPENIVLTIPSSFSSQVQGNYLDDKEWKTIRLRDSTCKLGFCQMKFTISAE